MGTESFLSLACAGLIAMMFGLVLAFSGYKLFLVLLPIWGFFFGFALGAQAVQALFGEGFLTSVTSWIVGFIVAAVFAVLAYLFYFVAVLIISGSLGYAIGVGLMTWLGLEFGPIVWIVGMVAAIALAIVTIVFNLQKWVIIIATGLLGAGAIVATIIYMFNPEAVELGNPIQTVLDSSWLLILVFLVVAVLGIVAQFRSTKSYQIEEYNRWEESYS